MLGVRNLTGERAKGLGCCQLLWNYKLYENLKKKKTWRWHILTLFSILLPYFSLHLSPGWRQWSLNPPASATLPPKRFSPCFKSSQDSPLPTNIITNFITHCSLCCLPPNTPAVTHRVSLSTGCICVSVLISSFWNNLHFSFRTATDPPQKW